MAVSALFYGKAFANFLGGETAGETRAVDWLSDSIKVALCTSSYVPNQNTHKFFSDITNEVAAAGGYTAGGTALTTKVMSYTAGTKTVAVDADDVVWSASTITARFGVLYDAQPGVAANNILIGYIDFGQDQSTAGGNFTIQWAAAGIFTFTVS